MKKIIAFLAIAAIAGLITTSVSSQPPGGEGERHRPEGPPPDPLLMLFDTNRDEEISTQEMKQATEILKKLDRNQDGILTREELPRPPRPGEGRPGKNPGKIRHQQKPVSKNAPAGSVIFTNGHQTDPRDHGRPVTLIAAALGVKPEVFRQAFSNVNPARGGDPTPTRARANKKVLMDALGKYGITNGRLDAVSNYYRYQSERGDLWKHTPATAKAIIKDGKVTGIRITNAGSGYTTPPKVTIAGHENVQLKATLEFSKNFRTNGSIKSLTIVN